VDQIHQLVKTPMYVTDDYCAAHVEGIPSVARHARLITPAPNDPAE